MALSHEDEIFNCVGTAGGIILACALIPQIVLAHQRRSAEDISYMWQAIYITGLMTLMSYYAHFRLWPVFFPIAFECSCLIYLTALKVYFEKINRGPAQEKQQASPLIGGARRSPKVGKYGTTGYAAVQAPPGGPAPSV